MGTRIRICPLRAGYDVMWIVNSELFVNYIEVYYNGVKRYPGPFFGPDYGWLDIDKKDYYL